MSIPFRNFDERVQLSQFQGENAIPEVMPIYDDLTSGDPSDQPHQGESGNTWWILQVMIFERIMKVVAKLETCLHHDKLRRTGYGKYQRIQDSDYLIRNFYWSS
jgi:hypothetical protein